MTFVQKGKCAMLSEVVYMYSRIDIGVLLLLEFLKLSIALFHKVEILHWFAFFCSLVGRISVFAFWNIKEKCVELTLP